MCDGFLQPWVVSGFVVLFLLFEIMNTDMWCLVVPNDIEAMEVFDFNDPIIVESRIIRNEFIV